MRDLDHLARRFEIAVENFFRSTFDLRANEAAFQAWFAASVIAEFGLSRVYREVHLMRNQLAELVPEDALVDFEKRNELVPDLGVSWEEAIDARHSVARGVDRGAGWLLDQFGILTELKVTGSTGRSTPPAAIHRDLRKLGLFAAAHRKAGESNPMAT